jgi:hypothetical protein
MLVGLSGWTLLGNKFICKKVVVEYKNYSHS